MNSTLTLFTALIGCDPGTEDSGVATEEVIDLRLTESDYEPGGLTIWGSDAVIQPGEDIMYCNAGTYEGPDIGIHAINTWQNQYGHHLQFFGLRATEIDYPDGVSFPCGTGTDFDMTDTEPVGIPTSVWIGGENTIDNPLLDGMAFKFSSGQRYLLQAHYVNTGIVAVRVHDLVSFDVLDPDTEVETWAAPLIMNNANIEIPAGQAGSMTFDCTIEDEANVLFANGHMHEWGTSIRVGRWKGDVETVLTDVPVWQSVYRDSPPTTYFGSGEVVLTPGDVIRTECNWFNDTDETLAFPHEMCDGVALAYPLLNSWICDATTGMSP